MVTTQEKGYFLPYATESSKQLVKKLYYAMKCKKLFYKFTKTFHPLHGLDQYEEESIKKQNYNHHSCVNIKDIIYRPFLYGEKHQTVPNILVELNIIDAMLIKRFYWDSGNYKKISKQEVFDIYTDYYFSDYLKHNKIKPVGIMIRFLFGTIGVIFFTIGLFLAIYILVSKMLAIAFGVFILFVTTLLILMLK